MSRRTERIADQLRAEIARVLREEVADPRIGLVTLTRVELAPDLSNAIVWWSALEGREGADIHEVEAGLASAAAFLRRRLASALQLKRTPALEFRRDRSLALGAQTLRVLETVKDES